MSGEYEKNGLVIQHTERLYNSASGNPRWSVTFDNGLTAQTSADAAVNYGLTNPEHLNTPLRVRFSKAGRITHVWPLVSLLPHAFLIRAQGRLMRVTPYRETFFSTNIWYTPVDVMDSQTKMTSQAIVETEKCLDKDELVSLLASEEVNAIGSAFYNATKTPLPEGATITRTLATPGHPVDTI